MTEQLKTQEAAVVTAVVRDEEDVACNAPEVRAGGPERLAEGVSSPQSLRLDGPKMALSPFHLLQFTSPRNVLGEMSRLLDRTSTSSSQISRLTAARSYKIHKGLHWQVPLS